VSRRWILVAVGAACVALGVGLTALLANIFAHKQEAKNPYVRLVEVTEETTDPAPWGMNWPREYDSYRRTRARASPAPTATCLTSARGR
jgi:nitrite reductase (cytochrome c-552)